MTKLNTSAIAMRYMYALLSSLLNLSSLNLIEPVVEEIQTYFIV